MKRILWIDIAKALAIICVVLGHAGMHGHTYLGYFQLPTFFFISGMFFKFRATILDCIKANIKRLYIPFIKYSLFFLIIHHFLVTVKWEADTYSLYDYVSALIKMICFDMSDILLAPLWFLLVLFIVELIYWAIRKVNITNNSYIEIILLCICYAISVFLDDYKILYCNATVINTALVEIMFFAAGYNINKTEKLTDFVPSKFICAISIIIILVGKHLLNMFVDDRVAIFSNWLYFPMVAFAGVYLLLSCAYFINSKFKTLSKMFGHIGKHTLSILALHFFAFKFVGTFQVVFLNGDVEKLCGWQIVYTSIGILIPLLFVYLKKTALAKLNIVRL